MIDGDPTQESFFLTTVVSNGFSDFVTTNRDLASINLSAVFGHYKHTNEHFLLSLIDIACFTCSSNQNKDRIVLILLLFWQRKYKLRYLWKVLKWPGLAEYFIIFFSDKINKKCK